jgi:hypothetical protein
MTRYKRQCPKCNCTELNVANNAPQAKNSSTPAVSNTTVNTRANLPSVIYDIIGITGASSIENALQRAFELFRRLSVYKFKYGLESPEAVFDALEKQAIKSNQKAKEAEDRLNSILESPEQIYFEAEEADFTPLDCYEHEKKSGYEKDFLDFIGEIVQQYYADRGLELPEPEE